jgi:hypothetical protein
MIESPLPFPDLVIPEPVPDLQTRAEQFAAANPELMRWLTERALHYRRKGVRVGAKFLIELARVEFQTAQVARDEHSEWKLNNSLTSRLARILAANDPRLADYFHTRALTAA